MVKKQTSNQEALEQGSQLQSISDTAKHFSNMSRANKKGIIAGFAGASRAAYDFARQNGEKGRSEPVDLWLGFGNDGPVFSTEQVTERDVAIRIEPLPMPLIEESHLVLNKPLYSGERVGVRALATVLSLNRPRHYETEVYAPDADRFDCRVSLRDETLSPHHANAFVTRDNGTPYDNDTTGALSAGYLDHNSEAYRGGFTAFVLAGQALENGQQ